MAMLNNQRVIYIKIWGYMEINKEMNIDAEVNCWIYPSVKRRCLKTLCEHSMNGGFQDWYCGDILLI